MTDLIVRDLVDLTVDDDGEDAVAEEQGDDGDKRRFIVGIDPGTTNNGWAWFDMIKKKACLQNWDFHVWDGYCHDMKAGYGERIVQVLQELRPYFKKTILVAIEPLDHKNKNKEVDIFHIQLAQSIRAMYPDVPVRYIQPQTYKKMWHTLEPRGTLSYEEKKDNSWYTDIMSELDHLRAAKKFSKKYGKQRCEDPIEAAHLAIYAYYHLAEYVKPLEYPRKKPSEYECLEMIANVKMGEERAPLVDWRNGRQRIASLPIEERRKRAKSAGEELPEDRKPAKKRLSGAPPWVSGKKSKHFT
jgi:hypothetical protein